MKPCELYKELILTNYSDGELAPERKTEIEAHIKTCAACRALAEDIQKELSAPLGGIRREEVPDAVWTAVKERIESESAAETVGDWLRNIWDRFYFPQLAPVLAGLIVMLVVGVSLLEKQHGQQLAKDKDQAEYMVSLVDSENESDGLGTSIEEYFL